MAEIRTFTRIPPDLLPVFEELHWREPIFHVECETIIAPDYWEVGASGRRYSREFIERHFAENPPIDAGRAGWQCSDYGLRRLGPDIYLFTYTLRQGERITRRATIWERSAAGWLVLYHQGTIVTAEVDDVIAPQ